MNQQVKFSPKASRVFNESPIGEDTATDARLFMLGCKRLIDIVISGLLLILLFPLALFLSCLIAIESSGFPIFKQWRKGFNGDFFQIYKFRTIKPGTHSLRARMVAQNSNGQIIFKFKDDPRLTRLGGFLRRYSLDELPQLLNVLMGDMSLVGPRPFSLEVFAHLPMTNLTYHRWVKDRHQCLPGMTGLWQVSGRNDLPPAELIRLDLKYVKNWSLGLDLIILIRTIPAVLYHKGAY